MIAHDAQTSGGLLMAVAPEKAELLLQELHDAATRKRLLSGGLRRGARPALVLQ